MNDRLRMLASIILEFGLNFYRVFNTQFED